MGEQKKCPEHKGMLTGQEKRSGKPTANGFDNNIQHVNIDFNRVFDAIKEYEHKAGWVTLQTDGLIVKINILDPFSKENKRYSFIDFPQTDFMDRVCTYYKYAGYITDHGLLNAIAKMREIINKAEQMEEMEYGVR